MTNHQRVTHRDGRTGWLSPQTRYELAHGLAWVRWDSQYTGSQVALADLTPAKEES